MILSNEITVDIRFSETDAMGVVWHGNYLKFFEDGRDAFGDEHGMHHLEVYKKGYFTPIVKSAVNHKSSLYYGEQAKVITSIEPCKAAKIIFNYTIINLKTGLVSAEGMTMQVFMHADSRQMDFNKPEFYKAWEKQKNIAL